MPYYQPKYESFELRTEHRLTRIEYVQYTTLLIMSILTAHTLGITISASGLLGLIAHI